MGPRGAAPLPRGGPQGAAPLRKEAEAVDGSDVDAVDPGVLRTARAQIHQGVGALELVGLPAAALVLRASEARCSARRRSRRP